MITQFFRRIGLIVLLATGTEQCLRGEGVLAFTHATVIDATGGPAQPDSTVIITKDRISSLGRSADLQPPKDAVIIDATGKYIIPGLWDMHVHWYEADYLTLFIANGVTGIRMMEGYPVHYQWRKEIKSGSLLGPRMYIASTVVDGPNPVWPGSIVACNEQEGRQAVARAIDEGADFVKVYSKLPREAYFAIAEEAKKQRIPFAGHVPKVVSVQEASRAGQKSIEHLTEILTACSARQAELLKSEQAALRANAVTNNPAWGAKFRQGQNKLILESFDEGQAQALYKLLKENHTWQCPTLTVLRSSSYLDDAAITNDSRLKYLPQAIRMLWDPANDFRFKNSKPEDFAAQRRIYQKQLEVVGAMQRAGVEIIAGTDTLNPYCFPGFSLHDELGLLVLAGLTPMQALQAATRNAARFMEKENDFGTVEKGKVADLVLLDANPLEDIGNTRKIASVVLGGKLFSRAAIVGMLAKAEAVSSKLSIAAPLMKTIEQKDVEAAVRQYHALRAEKLDAYDFREGELDTLGSQLLSLKRTKEAIRILKLNVEMYPRSGAAQESLGDAYVEDGNRELAIESYEKSLQLDPNNRNDVGKLKKLKTQ